MKRAVLFLCLAVFILIVIQPNLISSHNTPARKTPLDTGSGLSNTDVSQTRSNSGITIAIDPAKGGSDAGWSESGKEDEKTIAMKTAVALGNALEKAGYKVVYTRWYDEFSSNHDQPESQAARIQSAKDAGANLLISLQYNAGNVTDKGFTIFTNPNNEKLETVAQSLKQELVFSNVGVFAGLDTDHYANFPILCDQDMPAIMIQLGNLSHEDEQKKLADPTVQQQIGESITKAILNTLD